jgi:hypothetical protein
MSFRGRQRKRMKKIAIENARKKARRAGTSSVHWYLTIAIRATCCARDGRMIRPGEDFVYRASPREALCCLCAESAGIKPRLAVRWETARQEGKR